MLLAEHILYWLVRRFYKTEIAHTEEMKEALRKQDAFEAFRVREFARVTAAAQQYGVDWVGKDILDVGCHHGAMTVQYAVHGARRVIGIDIDAGAAQVAQSKFSHPSLEFRVSEPTRIPLPDESVDVILSFDVFEHVTRPAELLRECRRVLRRNGVMLIGTWGWYHPFAPHLWATVPVPWVHLFFSERTIMRTARRVYHSSWYLPIMHDFDADGRKKPDKYAEEEISTGYLNKFLISDFERAFRESGFSYRIHLRPFSSRYARWTRLFLLFPWLREFFTSYFWAVLAK